MAFSCGGPHHEDSRQTATDTAGTVAKPHFLDSVGMAHFDSLVLSLTVGGYGPWEVYGYCRQATDLHRKTQLVSAVNSTLRNYKGEENPGYWYAVLYGTDSFLKALHALKQPFHKTFLDIGSANGEKLYSALCMGFEKAYGLEYNSQLVEICQDEWGEFTAKGLMAYTHADALDIDGAYYSVPDFLYMYSPIKDSHLMASLYKRVMDNMKDGAWLLEVRFVYRDQLRQATGLDFPEMGNQFLLKKDGGRFFYGTYDLQSIDWQPLNKL